MIIFAFVFRMALTKIVYDQETQDISITKCSRIDREWNQMPLPLLVLYFYKLTVFDMVELEFDESI